MKKSSFAVLGLAALLTTAACQQQRMPHILSLGEKKAAPTQQVQPAEEKKSPAAVEIKKELLQGRWLLTESRSADGQVVAQEKEEGLMSDGTLTVVSFNEKLVETTGKKGAAVTETTVDYQIGNGVVVKIQPADSNVDKYDVITITKLDNESMEILNEDKTVQKFRKITDDKFESYRQNLTK